MGIRQKFGIPTEGRSTRDYFIVDELPYGRQSQVDFGQYYLRAVNQIRKKIHFFVMILARSRMKYVHFQDFPFTSELSIKAHETAWQYFEGMTEECIYDQDRLFLVDENLGEYLLTREFREYASCQGLKLVFCRKSDPQSKGKIENFVKFVKQNFLTAGSTMT
jgi:transposase